MFGFGASEIAVIIALIAGWALNELSSSFRRSEETRRRLSRALSTCIRLTEIFSTLRRTYEYFRSVSNDPVQLEAYRSRTLYAFNESVALLKHEIDEVVEVYREHLPFEAATASFLRDVVAKLGRLSLDTASKESEHYMALADSVNKMNALPIGMLTQMSRQLAAKIGPMTYIRMRFPKKKKPSEQDKAALLSSFSSVDAAIRSLSDTGHELEAPDAPPPPTA